MNEFIDAVHSHSFKVHKLFIEIKFQCLALAIIKTVMHTYLTLFEQEGVFCAPSDFNVLESSYSTATH